MGLSSACRTGRVRSLADCDSPGLANADGVTDKAKARDPEHPSMVSKLRCDAMMSCRFLGSDKGIITTPVSSSKRVNNPPD